MTIHATAKPLRTQGEEHALEELYELAANYRRLIAERDAKIEEQRREIEALEREVIAGKWTEKL